MANLLLFSNRLTMSLPTRFVRWIEQQVRGLSVSSQKFHSSILGCEFCCDAVAVIVSDVDFVFVHFALNSAWLVVRQEGNGFVGRRALCLLAVQRNNNDLVDPPRHCFIQCTNKSIDILFMRFYEISRNALLSDCLLSAFQLRIFARKAFSGVSSSKSASTPTDLNARTIESYGK